MARKKKKGGGLPPSFWKHVIKAVVFAAAWLLKKIFLNRNSNLK